MKKGITILDFLQSKEITPQDLKYNFEFIKRIDIDMLQHKGCPNCNNPSERPTYPSVPWTEVYRCLACDTIMITHVTDGMGGGNTDVVDVYKQKDIHK